MKLRLRHNSIRLRLTQSEVERFASEGRVEEKIQLGISEGDTFSYELSLAGDASLTAALAPNRMRVLVPEELAREWTETDKVGMEETVILDDSLSLRILVEKDFACLVPRSSEDDSDAYPHPKTRVWSSD